MNLQLPNCPSTWVGISVWTLLFTLLIIGSSFRSRWVHYPIGCIRVPGINVTCYCMKYIKLSYLSFFSIKKNTFKMVWPRPTYTNNNASKRKKKLFYKVKIKADKIKIVRTHMKGTQPILKFGPRENGMTKQKSRSWPHHSWDKTIIWWSGLNI